MSRKTSIICLIAMFAALAAAPGAVARSSHSYHSKVVSTTLSSDNGYPGVGGTALLVGSLDTSFGAGAVVDRVKITGVQGNVVSFIGGEVDYFANGTVHNILAGTATIQPDGSQRLVIEGRITGGTGVYQGARGHYRFLGTASPGASSATGHSSGRLTY
jgi:hypothetical protein